MKFLDKVRQWPIGKKRIFSISLAFFFTILIIILNFGINLIWKNENKNENFVKNSPINLMEESFSRIFNEIKPVLDQTFSSGTKDLPALPAQTGQAGEMVEQINSASSSFSTTSN